MNDKSLQDTTLIQISVALIVIASVSFLAGYYLGKKKSAEELVRYVSQQTFADKIYSSLCTLYDTYEDEAYNNVEEKEEEQKRNEDALASSKSEVAISKELYSAILCGFGSQKSGLEYVHRLDAKGVKARLLTRTSITRKGSTKTWYQVVSEPLDYESTIQLAERLKKEDKLTNVMLHKVQNEQKENVL